MMFERSRRSIVCRGPTVWSTEREWNVGDDDCCISGPAPVFADFAADGEGGEGGDGGEVEDVEVVAVVLAVVATGERVLKGLCFCGECRARGVRPAGARGWRKSLAVVVWDDDDEKCNAAEPSTCFRVSINSLSSLSSDANTVPTLCLIGKLSSLSSDANTVPTLCLIGKLARPWSAKG